MGSLQVAPEQQPRAQLEAVHPLQTPALQVPGTHDWQAAPAVPQAVSSVPPRQLLPEQQPEHEVESHAHVPLLQCCPVLHAGPPPHWQAPVVPEQPSAVARSQLPQVPPGREQYDAEIVLQAPEAQQPFGQEVWSQMQALETQRWPALQAAAVPHSQDPAVQLSALWVEQAVQVAPAWPQAVSEGCVQVPSEAQQPFGQLVVSHTQAPATQRCPSLQTAPVPQAQVPVLEQLSALTASQVLHAAPSTPQAAVPGTLQVAPVQQPVAQVEEVQLLQTPPLQAYVPQLVQAAPLVPQAVVDLPDLQVEPEQQPDAHEVESQAQVPPVQCCPLAQGDPVPQWQAPSEPQLSAPSALQAVQVAPLAPQVAKERMRQAVPSQQPLGQLWSSHTQAPETQRWPAPQLGAVPHWHAPVAEQVSALLASHAEHLLPARPQAEREGAAQEPSAAQQPPGQLWPSHTQAPALQRWPLLQAGPPPHWQVPSSEQLFASVDVQATQAAPAVPQVARLAG